MGTVRRGKYNLVLEVTNDRFPGEQSKFRMIISKLPSKRFLLSAPQNSDSPSGFMLNKPQFSTIKILLIPAPGTPVKRHTFSHKPLCHTHISLLMDTGTRLCVGVWQHLPLSLTEERTQPVVRSAQCDLRSRSPICFCFFSTNLSLQIDSSPAQRAGKYTRGSCSSWCFQIFIFSKDGIFSPCPLAESFALSCTQIACHRYSVFDLKHLLFTPVAVYRETTTQNHPRLVYIMAAVQFIYLCEFGHLFFQSLIKCS